METRPLAHLSRLQLQQELVAALRAQLAAGLALGEDEAVALAVGLDHLELEGLPDHPPQLLGDLLLLFLGVPGALHVGQLGDGDEGPGAVEDDQAPLVVLHHPGLHHLPGLHLLLGPAPEALRAGAAEGEQGVALGGLGGDHVDQDGVTHPEGVVQLFLDAGQLPPGDQPLGLEPDVHQHLVRVDAHDGAVDDLPAAHLADGGFLRFEELLHAQRLLGPGGLAGVAGFPGAGLAGLRVPRALLFVHLHPVVPDWSCSRRPAPVRCALPLACLLPVPVCRLVTPALAHPMPCPVRYRHRGPRGQSRPPGLELSGRPAGTWSSRPCVRVSGVV